MRFKKSLLLMMLTVVSCVLSQPATAIANQAIETQIQITPDELADAVENRESRVTEFQFIRQEADRLGLRVWLFGGTASSYLHYVKWDLQWEKGDPRFQDDRFDYDFTNIYRATQDLDIVADGNTEQIQELARALVSKYPQFLGSNTKWEVRSLRETSGRGTPGYKEALLNNFDFLNQNSDSNSTGVIEITKSGNEAVVRDLRDWDNFTSNRFLTDSASDKDTFYRSKTHFLTSRARAGRNPEIFSVIRALTKAFQFELKFSDEDWHSMQDIINKFDPSSVKDKDAVRRLKDISYKLFKNAVNLEYAWNVLEQTGLRTKLMQFDDKATMDSLAWWMNKEPLRTKKLGGGLFGKTARELGIDVVAHATRSFVAYENITRAHTGDANVFVSRHFAANEAAAFGKGFYTQVGDKGAFNDGMTIRFHLHPDAREGSDFSLANNGKYVVVHNKAAIQVIQESLHMSPWDFFQGLLTDNQLRDVDKGIIARLKRRLQRDFNSLNQEDFEKLQTLVNDHPSLRSAWYDFELNSTRPKDLNFWTEYSNFQLKNSGGTIHKKYMGLKLGDIIQSGQLSPIEYFQFVDEYQNSSVFVNNDLLKNLTARLNEYSGPVSNDDLKRIFSMVDGGLHQNQSAILELWFGWKESLNHPTFMNQVLASKKYSLMRDFIQSAFNTPESLKLYDVVKNILYTKAYDSDISYFVLSQPSWAQHPELVEILFHNKSLRAYDIMDLLSRPIWAGHPEFIEMLFKQFPEEANFTFNSFLLRYDWNKNPALKNLIPWYKGKFVNAANLRAAFSQGQTLLKPHEDKPIAQPRGSFRCEAVFL